MEHANKKRKRWIVAGTVLLVTLTGLQFVQQPVPNPPSSHPIKAPAEVTRILRRACYDCHSNESRLSWHDRIAPVSWLLATDIKTARSRFNLSTWDTLSKADQQGRLWEMVNMVLSGKMPLASYAAIHPESKLSAKDVSILKAYANSLSQTKYADTAIVKETNKELNHFKQNTIASTKNIVAANGVKYIPDYQSWQVISTTNRFDNHSIRVVYGNAATVKAIRENHINPFPDGSTIVKVVWNSIEEKNGDVKAGSLNSVQIMTKDNKRFPDSKGWGFAKFNGIKLKPYGDTPLFNTTCFNCHKIASENGYVFNIPLQNIDLK